MSLSCLDLFTGVGGMGRLLPLHPVLFCENAPFARRILERRIQSGDLPPVPIHGDVKTLLDPPDHDILIGGFPCQDISKSGLQRGLEGEKSSLFFEILRIVRLKHPQYIFLENVAHIINLPNVWQVVLKTLSAEGYSLKWCMFGANSCGALHRRNRWFILGTYTGVPHNPKALPEKMHFFGQLVDGIYSELPDPKVPRTRMKVPLVMKHIPGVACKGKIDKTIVKRTLFMTPRASGGFRGCYNKTKRSMQDLCSQLRFATSTPEADRHMAANLKWVENLVGLPAGWTDPDCDCVEDFPGFGKEIYKRMKPDKTQKQYFNRWKALGNLCVSQTALLAFNHLAPHLR